MPRHRTTRSASALPLVIVNEDVLEESEARKGGSADPASVRPRLAEAAAESVDEIRRTLLDAAIGATKDHSVTFECADCGSHSRVQLPVPDVRARVAAIELLLREGRGRPPQAEEAPAPRMPENVAAVKAMGWEEMQHLFAAIYMDEIAAIHREGGDALMREKLARLSAAERGVLREARSPKRRSPSAGRCRSCSPRRSLRGCRMR